MGRIIPHLFNGKPVEGACRLAAGLIVPAEGKARSTPALP
jgi:hypothetical protein